ncbi:MAG: ABC transporter permease [Chloroflexota bacterium]|nr:ABC transporter permease [Chloroflexota bacterium]
MEQVARVQLIQRGFRGLRSFARRRPVAAAWGAVATLLLVMAVAAPVISPQDPLKPDFKSVTRAPTLRRPFGTDYLGRDIVSRIIYGARISLSVALAAVMVGTAGGAVWGLASGYIGGKFDLGSQRVMEILLSFPPLILALALSMALGAGVWTIIIAIGITRVPITGRVIRSVALSVKESLYVEAARAVGASSLRIMVFHVGPQCIAPFLVLATMHLGTCILLEATLGFLGVGVPPPAPTWGTMLGDAATSLIPRWWLVFFPGLFITIAVLAFNLFGDGLRDALDPRLRGAM